MKHLYMTSPASDDSTITIRLHLRPGNHMFMKNLSPRLHLHPKTQPFEYEFALEPTDHMIMKNLPETSPAPDDSTIRIRVHLRTK